MKIIKRAMLEGEAGSPRARSPAINKWAHQRQRDAIAKIAGWQLSASEHLFALKQALDAFDFVGAQLAECDREIETQLQSLRAYEGEPGQPRKRGRARNAPKFDLRAQLFKMCGVDLTRIDGIDVTTALAVISETGADMSRFPSVAHFSSWLSLCPGTKDQEARASFPRQSG